MLTFAVVTARPGRQIPVQLRHLLERPAGTDLTFVPDDHVVWTDAAGRTLFAGWQVGASLLEVQSHWEVRPTGITAFSGHVWHDATSWSPGSSWAAQLADLVERKAAIDLAPALDGVFDLASLATDGTGCLTSDPLGIGMLYQGSTDEVVVVSNRAALAARLVAPEGREPRRDLAGAGWVAYSSHVQQDRTTFEGVSVVPQGSAVVLAPGVEPRVTTWSATPWLDGPRLDGADLPSALEAAAAHMRRLARTFVAVPAWLRTMELTGGRDSRLVLSLLEAEGIARDLVYITWGEESLPDVVVASAIADRFGLDLRAAGRDWRSAAVQRRTEASARGAAPIPSGDPPPPRPEPAPISFADQIRHHVWVSSGALSIWDQSRSARRPGSSLALSGLLGEVLRTNHSRTNHMRTHDELLAYHRAGMFGFDRAEVLRPDVRRHYAGLVEEQLDALRSASDDPRDVVDGYYQQVRQRRWLGVGQESETRNRLFPLYSLPAIRTAFGAGPERRRAEVVHLEVMRACCDELARMPFAGKQWTAGATDHLSDPGSYPSEPPAPPWEPPRPRRGRALRRWAGRMRSDDGARRVALPSNVGEAARMRDLEAKLPVFREMVDLGPQHPFYDLVDRRALERAMGNIAELDFYGRRSVHDAVTAAIWLSGAEAPVAPITMG